MTAPIETEADALALPAVRAAFEAARADSGHRGVLAEHGRAMIAAAFEGVPLGAWQERLLLEWLPGFEVHACAAIAAAVTAAREAGPMAAHDG
jgi:hypothetical protein